MLINAKVVSGRGMATDRRSGDIAELSRQLGISLINGSLNLVSLKPTWLDSKSAIYIGKKGHMYWHATLEGMPVIVNRCRGDCPAHIYEIYASSRLRDALNLKDNSTVQISLNKDTLNSEENKSIKHKITWYILWFGRETLYYKSNKYISFLRKKPICNYTWRATQS